MTRVVMTLDHDAGCDDDYGDEGDGNGDDDGDE